MFSRGRSQIQRESIYQDYDKGGICMTDVDLKVKGLRLAWIPRLLDPDSGNWNHDAKYLDFV